MICKIATITLVCLAILNSHVVVSFLPSMESIRGRSDFTHASITEDGIYKAIAEVIILDTGTITDTYSSHSHRGKVDEYFKMDKRTKAHFEKTVQYIIDKVNFAQRFHGKDASKTMSCEQIFTGNIFLHSLRARIIQVSKTTIRDWGLVRDMVGDYLFTLQEFYSNTNWVEMFGHNPYTELGVREHLSLNISGPEEATCFSCNYSIAALLANSCANNLIKNGRLTSGYTSDQNMVKPYINFPANSGKCSHGGSGDLYSRMPATGGINKGTSNPELSPHYHLHQRAGQAAVHATRDFLVGKDTGLLYQIGLNKTLGLLGMDYRDPCYDCLASSLSLVFVIDLTGPVYNVMQAKKYSVTMVNQALTSSAPFNYVLSAYSHTGTHQYVTTDGEDMKKQIQTLEASGDSNSPEMALLAMTNASNLAEPGSCIFSYINADSVTTNDRQDADLLNDVIRTIENKNLHVVQILQWNTSASLSGSGINLNHTTSEPDVTDFVQCIPNERLNMKSALKGNRRKRSIFSEIASNTSSSIFHTSHTNIGDVFGHVIQENMNIHRLGVDSFEMDAEDHTFSIDRCLSLFTVKLVGNGCSNIRLLRPDGLNQTFTGNASKDVIDARTTILSIPHPLDGTWRLKNLDNSHCHVTISGSGCLDFTYKLMEDIAGLKFPITSSNPVLGNTYTISVSVKEIPQNLSSFTKLTEIYLKKPDGRVLKSLPVSDSSNAIRRSVSAEVTLSEPFYIGIRGTMSSETVSREDWTLITPIGGQVEFVPPFETLVYHHATAVKVRVTNAGSTKQAFDITAADTAGFVNDATKHVTLDGNQTEFVQFHLTAVPPQTYTKLTITLKTERANSKIEHNFMVSTPPTVRVTNRSENCKAVNMNTDRCSRQEWVADLTVVFTASMSRLYHTPTSKDVELIYHRDETDNKVFTALIKGNCCAYKTTVHAVDAVGNTISFILDFSGENIFEGNKSSRKSERSSKPKNDDSDSKLSLIAIVLSCVAAAVAAVAASVALIKRFQSPKNQVDSKTSDPVTGELTNCNGHTDTNTKRVFTGMS
ncbi:uncharacterized protein LOC111136199 isoform X2 [Crassostrea virginica]